MNIKIWHNARLATLLNADDWGLIEDAALVTQGERILWVGARSELSKEVKKIEKVKEIEEIDLDGCLVTPGLIDCHTHLVYGGNRAREAEMRLGGASYEEIARAGGGIRSTVKDTRAASEEDLFASAKRRAKTLIAGGVTTLEIKSGYGLTLDDEAKCLRVARRIGRELPVQVRTTYLGAHALPPEFDGQADKYIESVCAWLGELHAQGLVDAVDAFCESIAFSKAQVGRVFEAARALNLPVKLHAEQLSDQGGAALAASFRALSADHLEHLSAEGIAAMKASGTVAVLLPCAYYMLRETHLPPVNDLRAAGVPIALASDHNPGTAPSLSLQLAAHMACTFFRLTPLEAILGMTLHAARALGLEDRGLLRAGMRADLAVWELNHPNELAYWFGGNPCRFVVQGGNALAK